MKLALTILGAACCLVAANAFVLIFLWFVSAENQPGFHQMASVEMFRQAFGFRPMAWAVLGCIDLAAIGVVILTREDGSR